ncbi:MAG: repressor LexA [Candidatus Goldbacteria bacterium]|nr:repressor LexA [Candidatus Goldiibacteriota bacterium]
MKNTLSESEIEALRHIRNAIMRYGKPPTVRALMKSLGFSSPRAVSYLLEKLSEKNIVKRGPEGLRIISDFTGDESRINTVDIPLVGEVSCGSPILAEQNVVDSISVAITLAKPPHKYFMLKAKGDSMNKKGINSGDLVLVRQQQTARNGDLVVALIDDEATIKEFRDLGDTVALLPHSTNPKHKPIILDRHFLIQGVVQKILSGLAA